MIICSKCGYQNDEGAIFCDNCGYRFSNSEIAKNEEKKRESSLCTNWVSVIGKKSFEKSWKKLQRKVKTFANDIYKFRSYFAIEPQIEKYFKKRFQKRVLPALKYENISSEQEKAICDLVTNFSFTGPDYFPHDEIDSYKGYFFIIMGIIGFLVTIFFLNEVILSFAFLFSFLFNGAYDLRRKSAGLAYANQLDSVYQGIKTILSK